MPEVVGNSSTISIWRQRLAIWRQRLAGALQSYQSPHKAPASRWRPTIQNLPPRPIHLKFLH